MNIISMKSLNFIFKNTLTVILLIFMLFTLSGCRVISNISIDDLAYVIALGIDLGDYESIKLSLQISTLLSGGSSGSSNGSEGQSSTFTVDTIDCSSIDSGINLINTYINKTLELSHCRAIIISEEVAEKGISPYIYTLMNKVDIRPDCNILICRGLASEYLNNSQPQEENVVSRYYDIGTNYKENNGYTEDISLSNFFSRLNDTFGQPHAVLTSINSETIQDTDKKTSNTDLAGETKIQSTSSHPQTMGLAVFRGDVLVGELNGLETVCHLLLTNKLGSYTMSIPDPFNSHDNIDLYINMRKDTDIDIDLINGSPYIKCKISVNARILSLNNDSKELNDQKAKQIEAYSNKYLEDQIYNYFNKVCKEYKSDIDELGKYVVSKFLTWEEWTDYNWLNNYQNSTFKIEVDTAVKSGYLIMES